MIVTEKEAKTKACPAQFAGKMAGIACQASGCMKWRWGAYLSPLEIKNRKEQMGKPEAEPKGFCDL